MATSATAGFVAKLDISTDGGSTWNDVSEQADITLTVNGEAIDATSTDSAGTDEFLAGSVNWTVSANGNLVEGDTGQDAVESNIKSNTKVDLRIRPLGETTGDPEWTGSAVLTTWEVSGGTGGNPTTFNMEAQGSGTLSKATI